MDSERRVRARMFFVLLVLWNISAAFSGLNLDCINDYDAEMRCHIEAQNCTEYNLTLRNNDPEFNENMDCIFKQCDGQCCCSFNEMVLVKGQSYTAAVWKGGKSVESKPISITDTIKPKTPTIVSVKESNGNFVVKWKTNHEKTSFSDTLMAYVTYHVKGDTQQVSALVKPATQDGLNYYEILGRHLKSSTTYVVSVKSYMDRNGKFSDSSEEKEFTTPMSPVILPLVAIISLSVAAVIITGIIYFCYVMLKTKWDTLARCPNPKLLLMHSSEQEVLKPVRPTISSVSVEPLVPDDSKPWSKGSLISSGSPQQSSGISTGSSCLSYANTEPADIIAGVQEALVVAFANISPVSPLTTNPFAKSDKDCTLHCTSYNPCDVRADDMSSGSSCFDNKTYSILIPSCQIVTDSCEAQMQAEMLCDSTYHPSASLTEPCIDQQVAACAPVNFPPVVLSLMPTDMSYQHCSSGGFPHAEDSSLSSSSSGTNSIASCDPVSRDEARYESFDEAVQGSTKSPGKTVVTDENPCYGSRSFPPMEDDYQPFHNLVEPVVLFSEERSDDKEEQLKTYPGEPFTKMPQSFVSPAEPSFMNGVQSGRCLSELQTPFISLMPADQSKPLFTDSGYQCV